MSTHEYSREVIDGAVGDLLRILDLEEIDRDLFRGAPSPNDRGRAFGGNVAAQAVIAAIRSADPDYHLHSLHSYFLHPGDPHEAIVYDVERLRDGRSFQTRRVAARQHGRAIYFLTGNFQILEDGPEHQDLMPSVPPPEKCPSLVDLIAKRDAQAAAHWKEWAAAECRVVGSTAYGLEADPRRPSQQRMWQRVAGRLPDDPTIQLAAFTWASDISLLSTALAAHGSDPSRYQMASLDHSIWFHRPFRADQWWLYDQESPSAHGARGLSLGRVFTTDGLHAATVAQEGLTRPLRR